MEASGQAGMAALAVGTAPPVAQEANALNIRLQYLFSAVAQRFCASAASPSVCVVQAWLPSQTSSGEFTLYSEPRCAVVSDTRWSQFRARSCHHPVVFRNSMTGRVWRTGAVQVVQNLRLVPPTMHPRIYLSDSDLDFLGEALYIPVYDSSRPGAGPMTVLEVLLPAHSQDPVCSADLLSFISAGLAHIKLSVSNPAPQPIKRSALCGRRARAAADSAPDMQQDAPSAAQGIQADPAGPSHSAAATSAAMPPVVTPVVKAISGPTPMRPAAQASVEDTAEQTATTDTVSQPQPPPHAAQCQTGQSLAMQPPTLGTATAGGKPCAVTVAESTATVASMPAAEAGAEHVPPTAHAADPPQQHVEGVDECEQDRVPARKVRKIGGGLVRSQSSFHIVGTDITKR